MHGVAPTKRDARGSTQDRVALRHKSAGPRWSTVRMQGRNVFIEFVPPNEKRSRRRRKKAAAAAAAAAKAGTEILSPVMDPPDIVPTVAPKKRCGLCEKEFTRANLPGVVTRASIRRLRLKWVRMEKARRHKRALASIEQEKQAAAAAAAKAAGSRSPRRSMFSRQSSVRSRSRGSHRSMSRAGSRASGSGVDDEAAEDSDSDSRPESPPDPKMFPLDDDDNHGGGSKRGGGGGGGGMTAPFGGGAAGRRAARQRQREGGSAPSTKQVVSVEPRTDAVITDLVRKSSVHRHSERRATLPNPRLTGPAVHADGTLPNRADAMAEARQIQVSKYRELQQKVWHERRSQLTKGSKRKAKRHNRAPTRPQRPPGDSHGRRTTPRHVAGPTVAAAAAAAATNGGGAAPAHSSAQKRVTGGLDEERHTKVGGRTYTGMAIHELDRFGFADFSARVPRPPKLASFAPDLKQMENTRAATKRAIDEAEQQRDALAQERTRGLGGESAATSGGTSVLWPRAPLDDRMAVFGRGEALALLEETMFRHGKPLTSKQKHDRSTHLVIEGMDQSMMHQHARAPIGSIVGGGVDELQQTGLDANGEPSLLDATNSILSHLGVVPTGPPTLESYHQHQHVRVAPRAYPVDQAGDGLPPSPSSHWSPPQQQQQQQQQQQHQLSPAAAQSPMHAPRSPPWRHRPAPANRDMQMEAELGGQAGGVADRGGGVGYVDSTASRRRSLNRARRQYNAKPAGVSAAARMAQPMAPRSPRPRRPRRKSSGNSSRSSRSRGRGRGRDRRLERQRQGTSQSQPGKRGGTQAKKTASNTQTRQAVVNAVLGRGRGWPGASRGGGGGGGRRQQHADAPHPSGSMTERQHRFTSLREELAAEAGEPSFSSPRSVAAQWYKNRGRPMPDWRPLRRKHGPAPSTITTSTDEGGDDTSSAHSGSRRHRERHGSTATAASSSVASSGLPSIDFSLTPNRPSRRTKQHQPIGGGVLLAFDKLGANPNGNVMGSLSAR